MASDEVKTPDGQTLGISHALITKALESQMMPTNRAEETANLEIALARTQLSAQIFGAAEGILDGGEFSSRLDDMKELGMLWFQVERAKLEDGSMMMEQGLAERESTIVSPGMHPGPPN